jgi:Domain of unknown function (DUF4214)
MKTFTNWLRQSPPSKSKRCRTTLRLEALEDRYVPTTFVVNSLGDAGSGTLRAAIQNAVSDSNPDADTINFTVKGTIDLNSALPNLSSTLTLDGPGANLLTISRNTAPATAQFRIFTVLSGAGLTLNDLTIQNGKAPDGVDGGPGQLGGAIYNAGNLLVERCVLQNNSAGNGGAGAAGANGVNGKDGTLTSSPTRGADGGPGLPGNNGGAGGAIYNDTTGQARVYSSTLLANLAGNGGRGGEGGSGGKGGDGVFTASHNAAGAGGGGGGGGAGGVGGSGGAIFNAGTFLVANCTIVNNSAGSGGSGGAGGSGGGGGNGFPNFDGGSGGGGGGASGNGGGGAIANSLPGMSPGTLGIYNCTITNNYSPINNGAGAGGPGGSAGAGIDAAPGNSGVSSAQGGSIGGIGTIGGLGGAPAVLDGDRAGMNGVAGFNGPAGSRGNGGILNGAGAVTVGSTIIFGNGTPASATTFLEQEVFGSFISRGDNLLGDPTGSTGFNPSGEPDILNTNPELANLTNNGGPTPTESETQLSPGINAGGNPIGLATDQRGLPRMNGPATDVGAYQIQPNSAYVRQVYATVLGRTPEDAGSQFWLEQLQEGASRFYVAQSLLGSFEHLGREVDSLYSQILHRPADAAGRAAWTQALAGGLGENTVAALFFASGEYASTHADTLSFIGGLYQDILNRAANPLEVVAWENVLSRPLARLGAIDLFLDSQEHELDTIGADYQSFLGRTASSTELNYWLVVSRTGVSADGIAAAFLASDEFFANLTTTPDHSGSIGGQGNSVM